MTPDDMKLRTKQFALRVLRVCRALPSMPEEQTIRRQLARCGTSVGANYRAAQRARSKAEFRSKLGQVEEEADESCFWLEVIMEDGMLPHARVDPLHEEGQQILAIITTAIRSARDDENNTR